MILAILTVAMAAVSIISDTGLYSSWPMIALWGLLVVSSVYCMLTRRLYRKHALFLLHLSFVVILAGAAVTHFYGTSQTIRLHEGEPAVVDDLTVELTDFSIEYYPGTVAPADFVSRLRVDGRDCRVSMNKVVDVNGYRFFQTACNSAGDESILTVTHDPYGTAVTYFGYGLLLFSMLWFILTGTKSKRIVAGFCIVSAPFFAGATPVSIPEDLADEFGKLLVYHNDRICPLSVLARDFTLKVTGSTSYGGLSPEQVMTGWLFYYDSWKDEPCIHIKDKATLAAMEITDKDVRLTDFFSRDGYRFSEGFYPEANEKFSLVSVASTGAIWKIFPCVADSVGSGSRIWLSPVDTPPVDMTVEDWQMARHSLNYLAELIAKKEWDRAREVVMKIGRYQQMRGGDLLPSRAEVVAEQWFVALAGSPVAAGMMLVCGILLMVYPMRYASLAVVALSLLWICFLIVLNWIASGHVPMSNGYETMQWMAFGSLVISLVLCRHEKLLLPMGLIVASLALTVAMIGQRNPQVTQLMPVLRSPLLSIHVLSMMLAYALLALMALSGVLWLCGHRHMVSVSRRMLIPALFLLAIGIFLGAVWANMSWGRYWGWDPKEVWALITMLVYCFPLHRAILPKLSSDRVYSIWCVAGFLSVLMTYFGVNYILGGLHSYA